MIAIDMMDFDGKEMVLQKISQNGTLYQQVQKLQEQMQKMAVLVDNAYGSSVFDNLTGAIGQKQQQAKDAKRGKADNTVIETDALGKAVKTSKNNTSSTAKDRAQDTSNPK